MRLKSIHDYFDTLRKIYIVDSKHMIGLMGAYQYIYEQQNNIFSILNMRGYIDMLENLYIINNSNNTKRIYSSRYYDNQWYVLQNMGEI